MKDSVSDLRDKSIGKLLLKQSIPASVGILILSANLIVDTVFIGNWIGSIGIAAINVVIPFTFLISSIGMGIGVGGSSVISRAFGINDKHKISKVFGNQITLTVLLSVSLSSLALYFSEFFIKSFGGKGELYGIASTYYKILFYGVPFLALSLMGSTVIRAENKPKFSMIAMIVPAILNISLDYIFIFLLDLGIFGAGLATTISYFGFFLFVLYFFLVHSEITISIYDFKLETDIVKEIGSLGIVSFSKQAITSLTYLVVNNTLYGIGGEVLISIYGIISRLMIFVFFPIYGITQGFLPLAGYNFGAENYSRLRRSIDVSIIYTTIAATMIFILLMIFPEKLIEVFLGSESINFNNRFVLNEAPNIVRIVFLATPILSIQLIGAAYFQAIGKALPAFIFTLSRQAIFFLPLVLILPNQFGQIGVWVSFPIADVLGVIFTGIFLRREVSKLLLE